VETFAAATLVGPGQLAAVRNLEAQWLRVVGNRIKLVSSTATQIEQPVACYPVRGENALVVVGKAGESQVVAEPSHPNGVTLSRRAAN
jgi:hypothetical protein